MSENVVYADLNLAGSTKPKLLKITDVEGSTYAEVKVQSSDTNAADSYTSSGKSCCSRKRVAASVAVIILLLLLTVCLILTLTPGLLLAKETGRKPPQWPSENHENHTGCPQGWEKYGRKCYYFFEKENPIDLNTSREECKNMSSDLVIIDNEKEVDYLFSRAGGHYYLLGLTHSQHEAKWKWINNAEYDVRLFSIRGNFSDYLCTVIGHREVQTASCHGSSTTKNMCAKAADV